MRCLSLSGLCWAKKTGIFILSTLTIITVGAPECKKNCSAFSYCAFIFVIANIVFLYLFALFLVLILFIYSLVLSFFSLAYHSFNYCYWKSWKSNSNRKGNKEKKPLINAKMQRNYIKN